MPEYRLDNNGREVKVVVNRSEISILFPDINHTFYIPFESIEEDDDDDEILIKINNDLEFEIVLDEENNSAFFRVNSDTLGTLYILPVSYSLAFRLKYICKFLRAGVNLPSQQNVNSYNGEDFSVFGDNNTNTNTNMNTNMNTNLNSNANNNNNMNLNTRNIPAGSTNSVMMNAIEDGNSMTNFHDEFSHGRYYKKSTYNSLPEPKKNPFSRELITSKTNYKAKIVGATQEGGRKRVARKTRKGRKGVRK